MDWDKIAAVTPPVDVDAVEAELTAYLDQVDPVVKREPWRITNLAQADWAMRRVAEAQAVIEQYKDQVTLWKAALSRVEDAAEWFDARLQEWAIEQRTPSRKSFPLAHGTVSTREAPARIEVLDADAAVDWARAACPDAVKVTTEFLVSKIGDAARIAPCVVEWVAVDKTSGEVDRQAVTSIVVFTDEGLADLQERLGDGFVVEARTELRVLDKANAPVPGLGVKPSAVTASVKPLMPV